MWYSVKRPVSHWNIRMLKKLWRELRRESYDLEKHKTLLNNRDKIADLIFDDLRKYLKEELFEKLCNNDKLTNDDINNELIKNLDFNNLETDEILLFRTRKWNFCRRRRYKLEVWESSNRLILEPVAEPSNVESYLNKWGIS